MALKVTNILYQLAIWHQSVGKQCSLICFCFSNLSVFLLSFSHISINSNFQIASNPIKIQREKKDLQLE